MTVVAAPTTTAVAAAAIAFTTIAAIFVAVSMLKIAGLAY